MKRAGAHIRKPKILWAHTSSAKAMDFFRCKCEFVTPSAWDTETFRSLIGDSDFLIVRRLPSGFRITENILQAAKKLKLIQKMGVCLDCIDVDAARKRKIPILTMRTSTDISVAEHTMLLILALSKNLVKSHKAVTNSNYLSLGLKPTKTTETTYAGNWACIPVDLVYEKTVGLVGLGEIGTEVARRALSFGLRVIYYRRNRLSRLEEKELGVSYRSFDELLKESDYISLHIPHTKESEKIMGKEEFSLMKRTAFFVNTSRGNLVDQKALCRALKNGIIAGAGLDVFEKEPVPKGSPLLELDNVILTPHIAGLAGTDAFRRDLKTAYRNILRFQKLH